MAEGETLKDAAMDFIRRFGTVQTRELIQIGIPSVILRRLLKDDLIVNPARGVYMLKEYQDDPLASYAVEAVSAPRGAVICLLTAAYLQRLIIRDPGELWLALPPNTKAPKDNGLLRVRCVWWDAVEKEYGMMGPEPGMLASFDYEMAGRGIPMTTPARTVADLFAYRKVFGEDVAVEALGNAVANGTTIRELEVFAEEARVSGVMSQFLAGAGAGFNRAF